MTNRELRQLDCRVAREIFGLDVVGWEWCEDVDLCLSTAPKEFALQYGYEWAPIAVRTDIREPDFTKPAREHLKDIVVADAHRCNRTGKGIYGTHIDEEVDRHRSFFGVVPKYSTTSQALRVLDELMERNWYTNGACCSTELTSGKLWTWEFVETQDRKRHGKRVWADADTMFEALCAAAVKVTEVCKKRC